MCVLQYLILELLQGKEDGSRVGKVHEDNIAGDTPYAQIAIEYEVEMLPLRYGELLLTRCVEMLGAEILPCLSFVTEHIYLDVGNWLLSESDNKDRSGDVFPRRVACSLESSRNLGLAFELLQLRPVNGYFYSRKDVWQPRRTRSRSLLDIAGSCSRRGLKVTTSKTWSWKLRSVLLWPTLTTVGRHDAARSRP